MEQAANNEDTLRPGHFVVGRYRIESRLGSGGTATVYRATDVNRGQVVAIKILDAALSGDALSVERFLREARAVGRVAHPAVVPIFDAGIAPGVGPYLVSEFVEGETLATLLARTPGPMPLRRTAELMLPLLDALAVAHEAGVVHRDIKPENIVLAFGPNEVPKPRLIDFGLSKILCTRTDVRRMPTLTIPGTIFGTPHYISPEQALSSRNVDARTDVWAAGVLLYRLLVGHVPFDAPNVGALLHLVFDSIPPTPASFGVPGAVSAVVMRCLTKDAASRYPDARALKHALCDALGLPSHAGSPAHATLPSLRVATEPDCSATMRPPSAAAALASFAALRAPPLPRLPAESTAEGTERTIATPSWESVAPCPTITTLPVPSAPRPNAIHPTMCPSVTERDVSAPRPWSPLILRRAQRSTACFVAAAIVASALGGALGVAAAIGLKAHARATHARPASPTARTPQR